MSQADLTPSSPNHLLIRMAASPEAPTKAVVIEKPMMYLGASVVGQKKLP
jgi:hypothetical protein